MQLDKLTLPEYFELAPCADRMDHAGREYSQFADLRAGNVVAQRLRGSSEGPRLKGDVQFEFESSLLPDPEG